MKLILILSTVLVSSWAYAQSTFSYVHSADGTRYILDPATGAGQAKASCFVVHHPWFNTDAAGVPQMSLGIKGQDFALGYIDAGGNMVITRCSVGGVVRTGSILTGQRLNVYANWRKAMGL